ncbi:MAG: sodium:solute symporter family protein [Planctomycetota bacterium]|jgi:SSS family transporter
MGKSDSVLILICVACYFVLCIGVGLWALRRTKNSRDFFMAGRNLGFVVVSVAVFSSTMSGLGFVGGPGMVYQMGMSSLWLIVCTTAAYTVTYFLLGRRMRMLAELRDSVSLPDVITARYGSRWAGGLSAVAILLGVMGYLAAQIFAMANVLQSLLADFGDVSLLLCAVVSTTLLVFYCVTGGMVGSVYTDLVQGAIMIVAAVLVFAAALNAVEGGLSGMTQTVMADDPTAMSPGGTRGMIGCLTWYLVFTIGMAGQPHIVTKLMMSRNVADARWSLPMVVLGFGMTASLWIGIGFAVRALVLQGEHPSLERADLAAAEFLQRYTGPMLAGVVFAGLFAAIMSTADAFLNLGAAAVVHDIPRALWGRPLDRELLWARVSTALIALIAMFFALYTKELVGLLGAFGWGAFAAALAPTVGLGMVWKRATAAGACAAIVASVLVNVAVKLNGQPLPLNIHEGALALLVSMTLFVGVSLLTRPQKIDADIEAVI